VALPGVRPLGVDQIVLIKPVTLVRTPPNIGLQQTKTSLRSAFAAEAMIRWADVTHWFLERRVED